MMPIISKIGCPSRQSHLQKPVLYVLCDMIQYTYLRRCGRSLRRVLFAPNIHDASPRVLVEGLSLNVPILVNRHILGGWKYVNNQTGSFFDSEDNVVEAFRDIQARQQQSQLRPREWFR